MGDAAPPATPARTGGMARALRWWRGSRLTTWRDWFRGGLGSWLIALVLLPLLLAGLSTYADQTGIESGLAERVHKALAAEGVEQATVRVDGRDVTVHMPEDTDESVCERAERAAGDVDGVRRARVARDMEADEEADQDTDRPTPTGTPSATPSAPLPLGTPPAGTPRPSGSAPLPSPPPAAPFAGPGQRAERIEIATRGPDIVLTIAVPDEATEDRVLRAARDQAGSRRVVDAVTVRRGAPRPNPKSIGRLVNALGGGPGVRTVTVVADQVVLSGAVPTKADSDAVERLARLAVPGRRLVNRLAVQGAGVPTADPALVGRTPVRFRPDSATLSPAERPRVRAVARELAARPELRLEVVGHAAVTGSPSADRRLGHQRARAVADELIRAGVSPDRLIVRSMGSTVPVSRDAAKAAVNRRVEFVVQGGVR